MNIEQFLRAIRPGLTLYGVLLTFALISFAIGRYFWRYEKELVAEQIDRLKDLFGEFRRRHIEPLLGKQLTTAIESAYEVAMGGLHSDLYPKTQSEKGDILRKRVPDEVVMEFVAEDSLKARLVGLKSSDTSVDDFLTSRSGEDLFDQLDHAYDRKMTLSAHYHSARKACARTTYAFLSLSVLLLVGILRILGAWPQGLLFFWLFLTIQVFAYAIYSFIRLEMHRRGLLRLWEELQIYGRI